MFRNHIGMAKIKLKESHMWGGPSELPRLDVDQAMLEGVPGGGIAARHARLN